MRGPLLAHEKAQPAQDDPSEDRGIRCQVARVHGARANPTSGSWPTGAECAAEILTSQVRSPIRCIWKLLDDVMRPSRYLRGALGEVRSARRHTRA